MRLSLLPPKKASQLDWPFIDINIIFMYLYNHIAGSSVHDRPLMKRPTNMGGAATECLELSLLHNDEGQGYKAAFVHAEYFERSLNSPSRNEYSALFKAGKSECDVVKRSCTQPQLHRCR